MGWQEKGEQSMVKGLLADLYKNLSENGYVLSSYYSNATSDQDLLYLMQYDWYSHILGYISTLYKTLV